jgi:hypothetical protein
MGFSQYISHYLSFPTLLRINSSNVFIFFNLIIKFFFSSYLVLIKDQLILIFYRRMRLKENISK